MKAAVTVTKLEWVKDENGNHTYDQQAITKFFNKCKAQMERQNAKIAASPKLQRSYSQVDSTEYANLQVSMYKHNFRLTNPVKVN